MLKVEIENIDAVQAKLKALSAASVKLSPALKAIGEAMAESTKKRFESSSGPDGKRWQSNSIVTELANLGRTKGNHRKRGNALTKKGIARLAGKKPLIGETKSLSRTINYRASNDRVEIGSPMIYAATQQFGAKRHAFGKGAPWGDIPARPFLGVSREDSANILDILTKHLEDSLK